MFLKITSLKHVIEIADILQNRYRVVEELKNIVYDRNMSRFINERRPYSKNRGTTLLAIR